MFPTRPVTAHGPFTAAENARSGSSSRVSQGSPVEGFPDAAGSERAAADDFGRGGPSSPVSPGGAAPRLPTASLGALYPTADTGRFVQEVVPRLLAAGLFREPVLQDGKPIQLGFAGHSDEVAAALTRLILDNEKRFKAKDLLPPADVLLCDNHGAHPDVVAHGIQRELARNPASIVGRDPATGKLTGGVLVVLSEARSAAELPNTAVLMSQSHVDTGARSLVDYWVNGGGALIDGTFAVAQALRAHPELEMPIDHLFAYSNPRQLGLRPDLTPDNYAKGVLLTEVLRRKMEVAGIPPAEIHRALTKGGELVYDMAGNFHAARGAELVRIIENAFPVILSESKAVIGAVGNRFAWIWEYALPPVAPGA